MADRRRTRTAVVAGLALAGAAGGAAWAATGGPATGSHHSPSTGPSTGTASVVRTDIAQRQQVNGTLGHSGTYDVVATGGQGVLTRLPAVGSVVRRGQGAYEVDGARVPLLYGDRPAWRTFELGMTDGADVRQLERNLVALGHGEGLTVDRHFSLATYWAVRRWQQAAHLPVTGSIPLGQIVFLPGPLRIGGQDAKTGTAVHAGLLVAHGTGNAPAVQVQLDPAIIPNVHTGDRVVVTLPDGGTRQGRISNVGAVAVAPATQSGDANGGGPQQSLAPVTITVSGSIRGVLDQAQVQVGITSAEHRHVLAVPILALLARPGGTYEIVVVDGVSRRHIPVQPGLFDETAGLAEVDGSGLAEGQRVEVPNAGA
jgi:HlyD family secretion protein